MKYIKYIGAFLLLIFVVKCISSSPEEVNPTESIDVNIDKWYAGGNLHHDVNFHLHTICLCLHLYFLLDLLLLEKNLYILQRKLTIKKLLCI
jgi:hypothetical protein